MTPRTIRYYVTEGLLPAPGGRGQRRAYGQQHLERLETIKQLKAAYLPLHEESAVGWMPPPPAPPPLRGRGEGERTTPQSAQSITRNRGQRRRHPSRWPPSRAGRRWGSAAGRASGGSRLYEPPETVWRRHTLAPGVELHYRKTDDPRLAEAIRRLIREAGAILDGPPDEREGS